MTGLAWNNVDTLVSPAARGLRPKLLSFERPGAPARGFSRPSGRPDHLLRRAPWKLHSGL